MRGHGLGPSLVAAAGRRRSSTFALVGATGKGNVRTATGRRCVGSHERRLSAPVRRASSAGAPAPPSHRDAVVAGPPARLEGVIGQRHGDDRIGRMPAPEQIVFPAVQVLGIEHVDPRTDDLVPLDRRDVVAEEVGPVTADHGEALELTVRFERLEFPDCRPGTGLVMLGRPRIFIEEGADVLSHDLP